MVSFRNETCGFIYETWFYSYMKHGFVQTLSFFEIFAIKFSPKSRAFGAKNDFFYHNRKNIIFKEESVTNILFYFIFFVTKKKELMHILI